MNSVQFPVQVDLQEGFKDTHVVLKVNGRELFHETGVSTRTQIGVAASVSMVATSPDLTLEVSLPTEGRTEILELGLHKPIFIGVKSDPEDGFIFVLKYRPFRYA